MKFVDYKCLESLLIEGEEIACESGTRYKTPNDIVQKMKSYKDKLMKILKFSIDNAKKKHSDFNWGNITYKPYGLYFKATQGQLYHYYIQASNLFDDEFDKSGNAIRLKVQDEIKEYIKSHKLAKEFEPYRIVVDGQNNIITLGINDPYDLPDSYYKNKFACESKSDLIATNPKDNSIIEILFLNKPYNVKISYGVSYESDGTTIGNPEVIKIQENAIKKILPMVNKLSLGVKDKLIQMIKSDANAIGYNLPKNINVLDYFKPSIIQAEGYYKNDTPRDRKIIIIDNRYKLDPEHGAAIEFINEKYSNMGQLDMFI